MMVSDDTTSVLVEENPYLALREAKIRRNEARLRELGLVTALSDSSQAQPRQKQAAADSQSLLTEVRRSKRLSNSSKGINYAEVSEPPQPRPKRNRSSSPSTFEDQAMPTSTKHYQDKQSLSPPKQSTPPAPNSVRSISLCTQRLTTGSTEMNGTLEWKILESLA